MSKDVTDKNVDPNSNPDAGKSGGDEGGKSIGTQTPSPTSSQGGDKGQPDWYDNLGSEGKTEVSKEAQKRGFKSMNDFWSSYREAEKKISTQGGKLKDAERFEQDVAPILDVIYHDEKLLNSIRTKLSGKSMKPQNNQTNNDGDKGQQQDAPVADTEARGILQGQIVKDFESNRGINSLDEETQKEVRKEIGKYMGKWVTPGETIPLEKLSGFLEDAYDVAIRRNKKLKETLEAVRHDNKNVNAEFSSQSTGGSQKEGDIKLTPKEEEVAAKMPGGREAYVRGKKKVLGIK